MGIDNSDRELREATGELRQKTGYGEYAKREFHPVCGTVHDSRVTCPASPSLSGVCGASNGKVAPQLLCGFAPDHEGRHSWESGGKKPEMVNHPQHYGAVPGIECIDVIEHFNLNRGNAIKYVWRAGLKGGPGQELEDLRKAAWYLGREIARLEASDEH